MNLSTQVHIPGCLVYREPWDLCWDHTTERMNVGGIQGIRMGKGKLRKQRKRNGLVHGEMKTGIKF